MFAFRSNAAAGFASRTAAVSVVIIATAAAEAGTFEWTKASNGSFEDVGNWTRTSGLGSAPPDVGDNVVFNEAGFYTVEFTMDHFSDHLLVSDGFVTFASDTTKRREYMLKSGAADANISGGSLQIGTATNPLFLSLPNTASSGSTSSSVMNVGSGADGFVTVEGISSQLDVMGNTSHSLGLSGAFGGLFVNSGATANIGTLRVGVSGVSGSQGDATAANGGKLNTGHIQIATQTITRGRP
ncbi:MAG: hypothetical protein WD316_12915 [Phycisphaeraceae bacterium]